MQVLQDAFFSSAYGFSSISGLKFCSSFCNTVFTRAVPRYPFSLHDELQHPEHTSIIRDPYSYDDGEQMAAHEEQALPGNSSYESCIVNLCLSTTDTKLFSQRCLYLVHIICCPLYMCLFVLELWASKLDCIKWWPWIWHYFYKFTSLILHWK